MDGLNGNDIYIYIPEPGVERIVFFFSITNKAGSIVELDVYYETLP